MELLLNPLEELTLGLIKEHWESKMQKLSIMDIKQLLKNKGQDLSHEKVRLVIESLWRKGEILIDVQGRERMVRPNHVTINSKSKPIAVRNFTILDENGSPIQRIWASIYEENKMKYFCISESRWNGAWKTTSNIIVPPNAVDELETILNFIKDNIKTKR